MAILDFSTSVRDRVTSRVSPRAEFDAPAYNPTQNALRRLVSPVPQSSLFGPARRMASLPMLGGGNTSFGRTQRSGAGNYPDIVPGPLGIYEENKGRPRQQLGKFGSNLLGSGQGWAPGAAGPTNQPVDRAAQLRSFADPNNPENRGFLEGLLGAVGGALGGVFGQSGAGEAIGSFVGSGFDLPFEAAGNVLGAPGALLSSAGTFARPGGIDRDLQSIFDEATKDNPIEHVLLLSHLAKAQHQRDADEGLHTGLWSDIGPAVALTDQVGLVLNALLFTPTKAVQRTILGTGVANESIKAVETAVRRGATVTQREDGSYESSDPRVRSNAYANLQMRLARGDFGAVGSKEARDKMMDELVVSQSVLRDVGDVDQKAGEGPNQALPFGMTFQGLLDMAFGLVTDPLIIGSGAIGQAGRMAKAGSMAANAKVFAAVPAELRPVFADTVEKIAMRVGKFSDPDRAWDALNRAASSPYAEVAGRTRLAEDVAFERTVLREAIQQPEFAAIRPQLESAYSYVDRWRTTWEPALRPITRTVQTLNDPFRLFGVGKTSRALGSVFNAHATEGNIRGIGGLDAHAAIQRVLGAVSPDALAAYNKGIAVQSAFAARVYHRNGMLSDWRRRLVNNDPTMGDLMGQWKPDEAVSAAMRGSTAGDVATGMEQQAVRFRPSYLADMSEEGVARARTEAANRLQKMGMAPDEAVKWAAKASSDEMALIDAAYFGYAMDSFVTARAAALATGVGKGLLNPDELTMLGPAQITRQRAEEVIEAVNRGDVSTVREALSRYDILYENLGRLDNDAKMMKAVRELLEDQLDALPREVGDWKGLTPAMREWAEANAEHGYRPGFRPPDDQMWRYTKDGDGKVLGINPWLEVSSTASDVPTYTRAQLAKDYLFHNIRGERIMADARVRLAEYTSKKWSMARGDSDALFARFIKLAQESGITPRGMSPESIYNLVMTHGLPKEMADRIGVREAVEALLNAFEGNLAHVGLSQKGTGWAKTALGGQGNWIGQIAEAIYPKVRFSLNPMFQAQELTESFILNLMRGIKPGWKASEMDKATLQLIEDIIRHSKYTYDDQIEYGGTLLWGADAAHNAFGPNSATGRLTRKLSLNDRINVKEIKRVNFAKSTKEALGRAFREDMERVAPGHLAKMRVHYGTDDMGEIAIRYLTEKGFVGDTPVDVLKPSHLGAREAVRLDAVAAHFDGVANADELRAAVRAGQWDEVGFRDVLVTAGADEDFASRAWMTASANFSPDEWWDAYRAAFKDGNRRATNMDRALLQAVAKVHNMTEAEYLAKYMADVPRTMDESALAAMAETEKRAFQFMAELSDGEALFKSLDSSIEDFRARHADVADREHFAIVDNDGTELASGEQFREWTVMRTGGFADAQLNREISREQTLLAKGRTVIHNHPSPNPLSPADMSSAVEWDVGQMIVTSPGITYRLMPSEIGWWTPEFSEWATKQLGVPADAAVADFDVLRKAMNKEWHEVADAVLKELKASPFFAQRPSEFYDEYADAVATNRAVETLAKRFNWKFDSVPDYRVQGDGLVKHQRVAAMAEHSIPFLKKLYPEQYTSRPVEYVSLSGRGTDISVEVTNTTNRAWEPRNLPDEVQRLANDALEEFSRSVVMPRIGGMVTRVTRAKGGWLEDGVLGLNANTVDNVAGTESQVSLYALARAYLNRQDAVVTSRVIPKREVANAAADERWSLQFVAGRELSEDESEALVRRIVEVAPDVARWGSSTAVDDAGNTVIRFVDWDADGIIEKATFLQKFDGEAISNQLEDLTIEPAVVNYHYISNDWKVNPNGEGYLEAIGAVRPDLARDLAGRLRTQADNHLAAVYRTHAPEQFKAHLADLKSRGEPVPRFRTPGQFEPRAEGVTLSIPGGREALREPNASFNLWEQQVIKSQVLNPAALYSADPELYVDLMRAIWRGKNKDLSVVEDIYNSYGFAAMTANSALDVTEGSFSLARARLVEPVGMATSSSKVGYGIKGMRVRAESVINKLPKAFQRSANWVGARFQMDEGLILSGYKTAKADWLTAEARTAIDAVASRIDEVMRELPEEQREAFARAVQKRLDGTRPSGRAKAEPSAEAVAAAAAKAVDTSMLDGVANLDGLNQWRGVQVQVYPFAAETTYVDQAVGPTRPLSTYIGVVRPNVRFKGTATNTQWGRVLMWLKDGIFDSDNAAVQKFIRQQPNESRSAYALRMSSILPGIDVKTGMVSMLTAGPGMVTHGAQDTHIVRYIVQRALQREELGRMIPVLDEVAPRPGTKKLPPGMIRAYHYTRNIDEVAEGGLDVAFAKGETYGEPNAIWFSTTKPDEDSVNFVEVWIRPEEVDVGGSFWRTKDPAEVQKIIDDMHAKGSNFTVHTAKIGPERIKTVSRPRGQRLRYLADNYAPGSPEAQAWLDDPMGAAWVADLDEDYAWAVEQFRLMHSGGEGLLGRLSPTYARHLREEAERIGAGASSAFKSPQADRVFLVPEGKWRKAEWSPEKEAVMRKRLALIEDPEVRALYDDPEVLRLVSETHGKINVWGGDYQIMSDYFETVLREEEVAALRAAGHDRAADIVESMSGGEWQWFKWDQIRSEAGGVPLDPHVSVTEGANVVPGRVGAELDRNIVISRGESPYAPRNMVLQKIGKTYLGANQIAEDGRRILLATQRADARTGLHELAHVFEKHLDPSMRETVIAEFRKATGSKRRSWSEEVGEWWADSLLAYARGGSKPGNRALQPSFEYFRKTLDGWEAAIKASAETKVLARAKESAIKKATKKVETTAPALKEASDAARTTEREFHAAARELRRARSRTGVAALEEKAARLRERATLLDQQVREANAAVRAANSAAKQARVRATDAAGTRSAGGLKTAAKRAEDRAAAAQAEAQRLTDELANARTEAGKAARKAAGARRRTPLESLEQARDKAKAAHAKAVTKRTAAEKAVADAKQALKDAKALSTKPARAKVAPIPLSEEMRKVWDDITNPVETPDPVVVGTGQPYDLQQETVYQAAKHSLSRAEEEAFRLHYYKRGRNFVERSINHPYFGLYPASYMWGKILPEMIRFLVRKPFGLEAPLGGLALAHNVYRGVMIQQQYDPEFRAKMIENTDMWHFVSMLTPSLPWEIPVNAPLWARRFAEANTIREDKLALLTPEERAALTPEEMADEYPMQNLQSMGRTGREMFNYAFGPAAAIEQVATAFGMVGEAATDAVEFTINDIIQQGQAAQSAPAPAGGSALLGAPPAMMPAQGPGPTGP